MDFLNFALKYAERGWKVFPLRPRDKIPFPSDELADEQGRGGFWVATGDADTIRKWWSRWPNANIGVATGAVSNLVVLDVDAGHNGETTLANLLVTYGDLPPTPRTDTGGGGHHYIFSHPGQPLHNSAGKVGEGLDIRGDGGYIVVPPSVHPSGRKYAWPAQPNVQPATMPEWLIRLATKQEIPQVQAVEREAGTTIRHGSRDMTLASLAGTMRKRGMDYESILAALSVENATKCDPPLSEKDVARIAKSITRYDPGELPVFVEKLEAIKAREPKDATAGILEFIDLINNLEGRSIRTYITQVDDAIGGLERQTMSVLAARPSMGKSTLAWQIARQVAASGLRVYFFSLEMAVTSLWAKAACGACGLRWKDFRAGTATERERELVISQALDFMDIYKDRLLVDDMANTAATIWEAIEKHRPDMVIVDHLRLVSDRQESEVQRLGSISWSLKMMAKALNCHVMLLAQLNRGVEGRDEKRPHLADLRDSGQIEENADTVMMMYREDYYQNQKRQEISPTELLIRKFRDDIAGSAIYLPFDTTHQWFGK